MLQCSLVQKLIERHDSVKDSQVPSSSPNDKTEVQSMVVDQPDSQDENIKKVPVGESKSIVSLKGDLNQLTRTKKEGNVEVKAEESTEVVVPVDNPAKNVDGGAQAADKDGAVAKCNTDKITAGRFYMRTLDTCLCLLVLDFHACTRNNDTTLQK